METMQEKGGRVRWAGIPKEKRSAIMKKIRAHALKRKFPSPKRSNSKI